MLVRATLCFLALALLCAPAHAGILAAPTGVVTVDGVEYPLGEGHFRFDQQEGVWFIPPQTVVADVPGEYRVVLTGAFDPDPSIVYGFSATDFGASSTFGMSITMPIVPTPGPTEIESWVNGGVLDADGLGGVSLTATLADADGDSLAELQTATANGSNLGIDVGPSLSFGPGAASIAYSYGHHAEGEQTGPLSGTFTTLAVNLGFSLSGGGDMAGLTGFARIDEFDGIIPEPSTYALAAIGLATLAGRRAMRRKR